VVVVVVVLAVAVLLTMMVVGALRNGTTEEIGQHKLAQVGSIVP